MRVPWFAVRTPYVAFALAYTAMFVLAFSAIGNFGLLTRQRTQVLPFVLVLLAVPAARRPVDDPATAANDRHDDDDGERPGSVRAAPNCRSPVELYRPLGDDVHSRVSPPAVGGGRRGTMGRSPSARDRRE